MRRLLYWIGLLIGITACVNPKGEDVLAEAERLMQAYPDSALSLFLFTPQPDALPAASSRGDEQDISPIRYPYLDGRSARLLPFAW